MKKGKLQQLLLMVPILMSLVFPVTVIAATQGTELHQELSQPEISVNTPAGDVLELVIQFPANPLQNPLTIKVLYLMKHTTTTPQMQAFLTCLYSIRTSKSRPVKRLILRFWTAFPIPPPSVRRTSLFRFLLLNRKLKNAVQVSFAALIPPPFSNRSMESILIRPHNFWTPTSCAATRSHNWHFGRSNMTLKTKLFKSISN